MHSSATDINTLRNSKLSAIKLRSTQDTLALSVGLGLLRLSRALQRRHLRAVTISLHESLVLGLLHALATLLRHSFDGLVVAAQLEVVVLLAHLLLHVVRGEIYIISIIVGHREVIIARMVVVYINVSAVHLEFERVVVIDDDNLA